MPTDEGPRIRQGHYAILGIAGVVIATVFAVVASLATRSASEVQPVPDLPGPVIGSSSSAGSPTTTTTTAVPTTTTPPAVTTTQPAPPPTTTTTPKPQPKAPNASFTATCTGLSCSFDGAGSRDPDGTIVFWSWTFGDGRASSGARQSAVPHTYRAPGTYTVTLLVMDNAGKVGRAGANVTVTG